MVKAPLHEAERFDWRGLYARVIARSSRAFGANEL
jgi:hypothetical protein